jgi:chromosome segregation ATPase
MVRAMALLVVVALTLGACAEGGGDAAAQDATARREARAATEATEALEERVAELEADLSETLGEGDLKDLKSSLRSLRQNLRGAIAGLRASLHDLKGEVSSASSSAASALSKAEGAARDLAVLEDRFNFHLKKEHGGG